MDKNTPPFHTIVATKLIAQLQQGTAPWQKPWKPGRSDGVLPMNPFTGKRYRGINALHLLSEGHDDPRWMTYKQAMSLGAHVRRGEKGTLIQYWKFSDEQASTDALGRPVLDDRGQPIKVAIRLERPKLFLATVFNASQIEGLPPQPMGPAPDWQGLESPERILRASGATICHAAHSAPHYHPATDTIFLPDKGQFPSAALYYATALHELGHWSGHASRLNRDLAHPFGSEGYAREELRAEIASLILGDALGIGHDPGQHTAYVGSWLRLLQRDPLEIFRAAADAEKIQSFVLGLDHTQVLALPEQPLPIIEIAQEHPIRQPVGEVTMQTEDQRAPIVPGNQAERRFLQGRSDAAAAPRAHANQQRNNGISPLVRQTAVGAGQALADAAIDAEQQPDRVVTPTTSIGPTGTRVFIAVPFPQHAQARALGARWDRMAQSWYIPPHVDPAPFCRWMAPSAPTAATTHDALRETDLLKSDNLPAPDRTYLAVPYAERHLAKAAGAAWDKVGKAWYVGPDADMATLARWRLENVPHQQAPALPPREEFAAALRAHGLLVSAEHPIMDGKKHRVPVQGGKRGALDGFYIAHLDGHPAGRVINYKTGADTTWHSKGYVLSREQTAAIVAQARVNMAAREAEQVQLHAHTAQRIQSQVATLMPLQQPTPYLERKGITPQPGVLTDRDGRITIIPGMDADGKLWTLQTIYEDGTKRFAKDSRKEGCFHVIGGMQRLVQAPALVISEGYATATSVSQALGFAAIAAFDASNLVPVAKALQAKYPDKPVIIAGDDDRHLALTHGENRGRAKAEEAAAATGGHLLLPVFAPGEACYPADLAPVTPGAYRSHLQTGAALNAAQLAALEQMKRHTDFNDLATRSALGKDAIGRQMCAFVSKVLGQHQSLVEQAGQLSHSADRDSAQHRRRQCVAKPS